MKQDQMTFFDESAMKNNKSISLSLDKVYLGSVCVVLLFIVSFSLGVERGKKISVSAGPNTSFEIIETANADAVYSMPPSGSVQIEVVGEGLIPIEEKIVVVDSSVTETIPKQIVAQKKTIKLATADEVKKPLYSIQIASYAKRSYAQKQVDKLEKQGHKTRLLTKGKWIALTVGAFATKTDAKTAMVSLKKQFKDCYIVNYR